jgi:NTP pyrophosphatase (non-canonical NTP hydrolase)
MSDTVNSIVMVLRALPEDTRKAVLSQLVGGDGIGDFSIGGSLWPGISKLIEECGEVLLTAGKLIGSRGVVEHWDGSNLLLALQDELAGLLAAISFVTTKNALDQSYMAKRLDEKLARFNKWHERSVGNIEQQRCGACNGLVDVDDGCLRCRASGGVNP